MNISLEFGGPNHGFNRVYDYIFENIDKIYPEVTKTRIIKGIGHCTHSGGRCGVSSMIIKNEENSKATILSFWDRGREVAEASSWEIGWGTDLEIVRVIGGLGIDTQYLSEKAKKTFTPFLYPLELNSRYQFIEKHRKPYIYEEKIKKACFIGRIYETRKMITRFLENHPLFDIYDTDAGYVGDSYYKKMNEYAVTFSLNGNGELCMRDFESMGLGIPILRSEVVTPLMVPLVADVDYIKGSEPPQDAWFVYRPHADEEIANQFADRVEEIIHNAELLTAISERNIKYFDDYVYPEKIGMKFFEVFNLEELR